jgi:predicted porin
LPRHSGAASNTINRDKHMKKQIKKAIASGVILMIGTMAAQAHTAGDGSNVTVYGYIDIGLVKEAGTSTKMDHGQNNWLGVIGSEKINDDLSAIFNVQMRFNPDTGAQEKSTTLFQGQTTVGLSSKTLGTIELGRKLTPLWAKKWVYDPWNDSDLMGSIGNYNGDFNSDGRDFTNRNIVVSGEANDFHNYSRISNGAYYSTPSLAGFALHTVVSTEDTVGGTTKAHGASLNYDNGPVSAMLAYEKNLVADKIVYLGGSYKLGLWKVMGSASKTERDTISTDYYGYDAIHSKHIAATYMIGNNSIRAGYGRVNKEYKANKATIGYLHALSKRTNLYADLYREKLLESHNGIALGMNHTF